MITAWFAKPAVKYGALALGLLLLVLGTLYVVNRIYSKGETAGKAVVTEAVQGETIKATEKARINKEVINEQISKETPDAVLDRTR